MRDPNIRRHAFLRSFWWRRRTRSRTCYCAATSSGYEMGSARVLQSVALLPLSQCSSPIVEATYVSRRLRLSGRSFKQASASSCCAGSTIGLRRGSARTRDSWTTHCSACSQSFKVSQPRTKEGRKEPHGYPRSQDYYAYTAGHSARAGAHLTRSLLATGACAISGEGTRALSAIGRYLVAARRVGGFHTDPARAAPGAPGAARCCLVRLGPLSTIPLSAPPMGVGAG